MKPSEAVTELYKLKNSIEMYLQRIGGAGLDNVRHIVDDLEEEFQYNQLHSLADKLDDVSRDLKYMALDIVETGPLTLNSDERFELPSGHTYTSGSTIEILYLDKFWERYKWTVTSIEHAQGRYYAVALGQDYDITGLTARRRARIY